MVVAVLAGLVGLVTVLVALWRDPPLEPEPVRPDWEPLPTPAELARVEFPIAVAGYDPATVEVTFQALAAAYADLLAVSDAQTVERARRRAALRLGLGTQPQVETVVDPHDQASPPYPPSGELEELRTQAALALLDDAADPPEHT